MTMHDIAVAALFTPMDDETRPRWGWPLLFWSGPGKGKTSLWTQVCGEYSLPLKVLSPAEEGEGGFGVVPCPFKDNDTGEVFLENPPRVWVKELRVAGGLVFVDDCHLAPPAVQPYLMGLFLARRLGDYDLGPNVRTAAAANPSDTSNLGSELDAAVANRIGHVKFQPWSARQWGMWKMQRAKRSAKLIRPFHDLEADVLRKWPDAYATTIAQVSSFLESREELFDKPPAMGHPDASRGWPSPRSWDQGTNALAGARVHGLDDDDQATILAAFVGAGAGDEFWEYSAKLDIPNFAKLLDGEIKWRPDKGRADLSDAVLRGCLSLVVRPDAEKRMDRAAELWAILAEVAKGGADIVAPYAIELSKASLMHMQVGKKGLAAQPAMANLLKMMKASGLNYEDIRATTEGA